MATTEKAATSETTARAEMASEAADEVIFAMESKGRKLWCEKSKENG